MGSTQLMQLHYLAQKPHYRLSDSATPKIKRLNLARLFRSLTIHEHSAQLASLHVAFAHCVSALYIQKFLVTRATLINMGDTPKLVECKFPDGIVNLYEWARHLRQCRYSHWDLPENGRKRLNRFLFFGRGLVEALEACVRARAL